MTWPFGDLPRGQAAAVLDPPWRWKSWGKWRGQRNGHAPVGGRDIERHYECAETEDIASLPVSDLAAPDCVLFCWVTWPMIDHALHVIDVWGFEYKTCAFAWMKADVSTLNLFQGPRDADMKLGYWTRANSEVCLLATRGKPKRLNADVRQGIIEPAREHSRKPDCIYDRIERLVAGTYVELFARNTRKGWSSWGLETQKFGAVA